MFQLHCRCGEFRYNDPKKVFPPCTSVESLELAVWSNSVEFGMSEFHREEWLLCTLYTEQAEKKEYGEDGHINIAVLPEPWQEYCGL